LQDASGGSHEVAPARTLIPITAVMAARYAEAIKGRLIAAVAARRRAVSNS
jgi:hypothetical protein